MTNEGMQLRISDVFHALYKFRILILSLTIVGLGTGILFSIVSYARGEISKEYAVSTAIAVTSVTEDGLFSTKSSNPNSTDIYLAENMVDSVIYVMKSDRLLNKAVDRMGLVGISVGDITGNLSMKQYNETQIIEITLFWRSAEEGVQILSAINEVAPSVLIDTLKIGGVSVVSDPVAKYRIGGNLNVSLWIYMTILGFMVGVGFAVIQVMLFPKLVNPKDMERRFGMTVFGVIPENKAYYSTKHDLLADDNSGVGTNILETFSSAAHILYSQLRKNNYKTVYITSTAEAEGRTNITANLGVQLAKREKKVLMIDFDIHNPTLGSHFLDKVEESHSLNALYRGSISEKEAITHITGFLDLLPARLESSELPLDDAMMDIINRLAVNYDFVLMDTSPIGKESDTMNLNQISDAVLFIAGFDSTGIREIHASLEKLEKSGANNIGCIVNGVRQFRKHA